MFAGAALVATSVGITASVLAERKLLNEGASQIILAAAVIDDVLGLIVLAVVSSVAGGHERLAGVFLTAALAVAFLAVVAFWGPALVRRWLPSFRSRARADEAEFHIAMLLLFALSAVALYTGVAAIVGAFLAGLVLAAHVDKRVRTLTRGVSELLVPFFLAGIGLNFDAAIFRSTNRSAGLVGAGGRDCQQSARVWRCGAFSRMAKGAARGRGHGAARGSGDDRRATGLDHRGAERERLQRDRVCGGGHGAGDAAAAANHFRGAGRAGVAAAGFAREVKAPKVGPC